MLSLLLVLIAHCHTHARAAKSEANGTGLKQSAPCKFLLQLRLTVQLLWPRVGFSPYNLALVARAAPKCRQRPMLRTSTAHCVLSPATPNKPSLRGIAPSHGIAARSASGFSSPAGSHRRCASARAASARRTRRRDGRWGSASPCSGVKALTSPDLTVPFRVCVCVERAHLGSTS